MRLFAEGPPSNETASLRRTMGSENDSPARQLARFVKEEAARAVPEMNVWIIYRRDRFLRGSDHTPFLDRPYPTARFTEPNEDFRHEHQNVRVENGVQFGDLAPTSHESTRRRWPHSRTGLQLRSASRSRPPR